MPYKQYSDSYLLKMNKKEIIDLLRVSEHNFFATEEGLQNSARFGAEVLAENAELKRLLKAAVKDIHELLLDRKDIRNSGQGCNVCNYIEHCNCCESCTVIDELKVWRYADEAMKLIVEDSDIEFEQE